MVYRFKLVSDEVNNFSREIEIDSENTFLQFRNAILDSVDFTKDELDSFFLCDDEWNKQEEITLEDMGESSSDTDLWLMEDTTLSELIEEEGQRLIFEFDYMTQRGFFMELKEIIPSRRLTDPLCTMKRGKGPKQFIDLDVFEKKIDTAAQKKVEDFDDIDIYPAADFNDEELSEGFDIMDLN
ncbi:MAG: plasmid pRiA4b ORF-3 family protein [Bacteroidales bacterium]|nr:plasmid pRiA4b ORF-3 family protein [Bacteroidales bacterium]MBD5272281.1 plasmid pRiA4b ORF-3 family protein [Bacteroides sp.]MDE6257107.1 hypothetical protein [Muribaculaceae bacterium]MBD5272331.1 plasmid pRiA4b ORF-3 family protein [Bacteroides sp.]MBD5272504.1 plasmid pRiA4b ORF-3 family protein [Bacteroides sp.]